jgi:hypothetical protein
MAAEAAPSATVLACSYLLKQAIDLSAISRLTRALGDEVRWAISETVSVAGRRHGAARDLRAIVHAALGLPETARRRRCCVIDNAYRLSTSMELAITSAAKR